jgi:uncharacterized protein (DUF1800 family)
MRLVGIGCAVLVLLLSACATNPRTVSLPRRVQDRDSRVILHVLNRLGFGARPEDVARVSAIGVRGYIEQQLHPASVSDTALEARLANFSTLRDSSYQFAREYYPAVIQARKELAALTTLQRPAAAAPRPAAAAAIVPLLLRGRTLPIAAVSLEGQMPMRVLGQGTVTPEELRMQRHNQQTLAEMQQAKLLRAVYSEHQLEEVLTDFWMNHFNVFAGKVEDFVLVSEMERQTIRPYVFGRFRDMLGAVAKSPAMLVFLDNYLNGTPTGKPPQVTIGLNENYARELMELHTLGVDGGYTQADVREVARCFTGWTVKKIHEDPTFVFDPKRHDRGPKMVLGHRIESPATAGAPNRGIDEAEMVLDIVARHPSTARFIATKLARRFVSDTPPKPLIDRAAKTFLQTDGDLRAVVQSIVTSPEFYAPEALRAKIKSPFEFIVSALRATNANVIDPAPIVGTIAQLGEPLYFCLPPTGYPDRADAWVNTGGLFSRMNIAASLAANNLAGVKIDLAAIGKGSPAAAREQLAIVLGAPEFQHR